LTFGVDQEVMEPTRQPRIALSLVPVQEPEAERQPRTALSLVPAQQPEDAKRLTGEAARLAEQANLLALAAEIDAASR
jgi:hypothetical protein